MIRSYDGKYAFETTTFVPYQDDAESWIVTAYLTPAHFTRLSDISNINKSKYWLIDGNQGVFYILESVKCLVGPTFRDEYNKNGSRKSKYLIVNQKATFMLTRSRNTANSMKLDQAASLPVATVVHVDIDDCPDITDDLSFNNIDVESEL
jgi:hypothetical protein